MRWIVVVAVVVASSGCGSESAKWRRTAEDYKAQLATANTNLDQARTDLKEQSENWQHQSQKLNAAMIDASAKLDPIEIRQIYLSNRDLTAVAHQLEGKIALAKPQDGDLMLSDAQLRFDVTGYKGQLVIRAYLDYELAPFLVSELAANEPVLPLPYNIATAFYDEIFKADRAHASESASSLFPLDDAAKDEITAKLADTHFASRRGEIDTRYKDTVTSEFSAYIKRGGTGTTRGLPNPVFLARQFRTPGRHEIRIQVEPKSPDWEVRLTATEVMLIGLMPHPTVDRVNNGLLVVRLFFIALVLVAVAT
jgi:hypothetical protein